MSGMTKVGTGAKLEDSNIALYGSKEHKDAKKAAADSEAAWQGAGKNVGVQIWRIEKFKVVHWPKESYGSFFSGDSYIILHTYKVPDVETLKYNLHFWLGKETSQDEAGTAAYKTVELDDFLGDQPVQYREVEGHESEEFMAIFNGKIVTMAGGVDSGFNKVKPTEYNIRLLHLKSGSNKKNVHVTQVPVKLDSLNDGDVFILDGGLQLAQWNGRKAGMFEKRKAAEIIQAIRQERMGKPVTSVVDGCEAHKFDQKVQLPSREVNGKRVDSHSIWEALGETGVPAKVNPETPDEDAKLVPKEPSLWRLSDASGKLTMTQSAAGKASIKRALLDHNDVFILDTNNLLYAWVGKGASKEERIKATESGAEYLVAQGRDSRSISIKREVDGAESKNFWANFAD